MRPALAYLALFGGLCAALPAQAGGTFAPPQGCTLEMTVQLHSCQVANHYRCAADPAGDQWVSLADGKGEFFRSHIDSETRWIGSLDLETGDYDALDAAASADNASFSALLSTGRDDYDFVTRSSNGEVRRYIGHDQLTGERVTIGGVALERCSFEMRIEDGAGNALATRKGMQLISRKLRLFFSDTETYETVQGDHSEISQAPVTFAFPGDKGFAAAEPEFDCDMMMTNMSPNPDRPTL